MRTDNTEWFHADDNTECTRTCLWAMPFKLLKGNEIKNQNGLELILVFLLDSTHILLKIKRKITKKAKI